MQGLKGIGGNAGTQGRLGAAGLKVITSAVNDKGMAGLKSGKFAYFHQIPFTFDILGEIYDID